MFQSLSLAEHSPLLEQARTYLLSGGVSLLSAVLILIAGWIVSSWLSGWMRRVLARSDRFDETLKPITVSLVRYTVLIITLVAVLNRFGVQTTSLIAVIGAAGLAIGLAMQGTLSNVAAGAMLLMLRPFRAGDYVEVGGQGGTVREIGLFTTVLTTPDLIYISVPNSQIFNGTIVNYSREPTRRVNFTVGIDYADDIDKAQAIVLALMEKDGRIHKDPAPMVPVGALGASSVDLIVRCWVANPDYWAVLFDLQKSIKQALDAGGITIPFPQRVVTLKQDGGTPPG